MQGLIGRKVGMTEVFIQDGTLLPVTVVKLGPCFVTQKRTAEKEGYVAVQVGFEEVKPQRLTKPKLGHLKKASAPPLRVLKEFPLIGSAPDEYNHGDVIKADVFKDGDMVDVTGTSKGKGFAGAMKRHGFAGQPDSHGGMSHRKPGSIGQHSYPARVWKGMRMPGHMGNVNVTSQGLQVVRVDLDNNLVIIKGSIPGPDGGLVFVKHATKGRRQGA
ncbi:MAG: 50S ribosomal protein L3 [Deltaproteobacteria bacterium]